MQSKNEEEISNCKYSTLNYLNALIYQQGNMSSQSNGKEIIEEIIKSSLIHQSISIKESYKKSANTIQSKP